MKEKHRSFILERACCKEGHFIESMKCNLEKNANTSYIRL